MIPVRCRRCNARLMDSEVVEGYIEVVCRNCKYKNKLHFTATQENGDFQAPEGTEIISIVK